MTADVPRKRSRVHLCMRMRQGECTVTPDGGGEPSKSRQEIWRSFPRSPIHRVHALGLDRAPHRPRPQCRAAAVAPSACQCGARKLTLTSHGYQGMSCTWDVTKAIKKHYNFE